jgi:hypothetical protein
MKFKRPQKHFYVKIFRLENLRSSQSSNLDSFLGWAKEDFADTSDHMEL